jgi:hypothetical protein
MNREEIKEILLKENFEKIVGRKRIKILRDLNIIDDIKRETHYLDNRNMNTKIKERIFHILNDVFQNKICKNKNCNNFVEFKRNYSSYCCLKCSAQDEEVRNKYKQTCLEKYGTENVSGNKEIDNKKRETWLKKYGTDHPFASDIIKNKRNKTWLEKYGYEHPKQSEEIKEKYKQTCLKKYGYENQFQNEEVKEKIKKTNLEKFGVENPSQCQEIKEKIKQINLEKFIPKILENLNSLNLELIDSYSMNNRENIKFKCLICNNIFETCWQYIQNGNGRCPICFPKLSGSSFKEKELSEFIKSLNLEIIENSRTIIFPKELDIFIPSKNIAIEFNGLYWHSEINIQDKNYHLNKLKLCQEKNIRLIQIFEDEWIFKKNIVKARLKQILNINDSVRIHARKCVIKEINPDTKNEFLENYHIQGKDTSCIKLGAFYNNELISVMTFSKGSISKGSKSEENIWELNRFCSNYNYHIPGIASKLLSYFRNNYTWNEIFSYADLRWSEGNVYYKLGFELSHASKPNYWYFKDCQRLHRFNLRKRKDEPKDITENILRANEGYFKIYDCGNIKFILENKINDKS